MWTLFLHLSDEYLLGLGLCLLALIAWPVLLIRLRRRSNGKPQHRKWLAIGLSLWFVAALLTALEIGFALLYDTTDSFSMTNTSRRWFEVHVAPDLKLLEFSDGTGLEYRDDKVFESASRRDDVQHTCVLGDSFTFGHGVPQVRDRFSNQLQNQLEAQKGIADLQPLVTNLSKPGADLNWVAAALKKVFTDGHRVDAAVYIMCLNDIEAFHDPTMSESIKRSHFNPPTFLFRDTYFFNWAWFRFQQLSQAGVQDYYGFVKDYYGGPAWPRFQAKLGEVQHLCRRNNCEFSIVVFPFLHSGANGRFSDVRNQIVESCDAEKISAIDLSPAFEGHHSEGLTVNAFDAHPNERAHQLAAEFLARQMLQ